MDPVEKIQTRLTEIAETAAAVGEELDALMLEDTFDEDAFADVQNRAAALESEADKLRARKAEYEARQLNLKAIRDAAARGNVEGPADTFVYQRQTEDVYDLSTLRGDNETRRTEMRARALTAVEQTADWEFESGVTATAERSKTRLTHLLEHKDDRDGTIANMVMATNSAVYKRAWVKAVTGRESYMTAPEREAMQRAASLTDASGGYAVPMPIDPTLIQLGDGAQAPVRQFARVETITNDVWRGLASTQVSASWDAEAAEASDDTPTWSQPTITAHKAAAFVPASIEVTQDYASLASDLVTLFADSKTVLESSAFATGTGSGQPYGIVTAITASATSSAGANTFAIADVYSLHEALPPRYRVAGVGRTAWASNITILNDIRQFGTANNYHGFTVDLTEANVPAILGRPWFEMSGMDGTYGAGENYVLMFGDWSQYVIVDRVGMSVEYIPHLFATANNRPSGQRGWYAYWRVGADDVSADGAFELLNVT